MRLTRRRLGLSLATLPALAAAQEYPGWPVRLVIGFPPGGYTLFYGNVGNLAVTNALYRNLGFDTLRDFVPVAQTMESVAVTADLPVRSAAELLAYARADPGRLNGASAGAGGPTHLALELFRRQFGLNIVHGSCRGSAPAILDLAGGRVRVLAVTAAQRPSLLPQIPTTTEAGGWHMLMGPARHAAARARPAGRRIARRPGRTRPDRGDGPAGRGRALPWPA